MSARIARHGAPDVLSPVVLQHFSRLMLIRVWKVRCCERGLWQHEPNTTLARAVPCNWNWSRPMQPRQWSEFETQPCGSASGCAVHATCTRTVPSGGLRCTCSEVQDFAWTTVSGSKFDCRSHFRLSVSAGQFLPVPDAVSTPWVHLVFRRHSLAPRHHAANAEELLLLMLHVYKAVLPNMDFLLDYGGEPRRAPSCRWRM